LLHVEARAHGLGVECLGREVPGPNGVAVRHLLGRGFRLDPWVNVLMSNRPFGQFDWFISFGPSMFLEPRRLAVPWPCSCGRGVFLPQVLEVWLRFGFGTRSCVSQQDRNEHGEADRADGADRGGEVQATGERLASGIDQCGTELPGKLPGHLDGATEGVAGGLCGLGRSPGRHGEADRAPVDGRADAAEHGVEVRSGGPAIEFATIASVMYDDPAITLGYMNTEQAAQFHGKEPMISVVAPMDISPGVIMWDPATHPDWNTMVDIGQTDSKVLVTKDDIFPDYLVGSGILRQSQLLPEYDGSPAKFLESRGEIAQGGFATAEPYIYEHDLREWGKPIAFQLIHDTGFEAYTQTLAVRAGDKDKLAPCLRKLVPLLQRSIVDFNQRPGRTNRLIVDLVDQYAIDFWTYGPALAAFSVRQQRLLGIVGNGPDQTIGNFDMARVSSVLEIVRPILAGRRQPLKAGLRAEDLATNEFIDPRIGLP
jgi:hypothetical protein